MYLTKEQIIESLGKLNTKIGSITYFLKILIMEGFFDSPKTSLQVSDKIRDRFGKTVDPSYISVYMKPLLFNGIIRGQLIGRNKN
ncbi:MAG: hypothetical protein ACE5KE_15715, partial [Methanosarcinales archaeon]